MFKVDLRGSAQGGGFVGKRVGKDLLQQIFQACAQGFAGGVAHSQQVTAIDGKIL